MKKFDAVEDAYDHLNEFFELTNQVFGDYGQEDDEDEEEDSDEEESWEEVKGNKHGKRSGKKERKR